MKLILLIKGEIILWHITLCYGAPALFDPFCIHVQKSPLSNWQDTHDAWPVSSDDSAATELKKASGMTGPRCSARFEFEGKVL